MSSEFRDKKLTVKLFRQNDICVVREISRIKIILGASFIEHFFEQVFAVLGAV